MALQPRANKADPRRQYGHAAYDVSYGGKAKETGPSGINQRLMMTPQYLMTFQLPADITTAQLLGDLTEGLIITGMINHTALGASRTVTLLLPAIGADTLITLTTAESLTAVGPVTLDAPIYVPLTRDRPLTATIAAGTAGQVALFSLLVAPIVGGWY